MFYVTTSNDHMYEALTLHNYCSETDDHVDKYMM